MDPDYRCRGCGRAIHWFHSMDYNESVTEARHGAHYWCPDCWVEVPDSQATAVGNQPVAQRTLHFAMSSRADEAVQGGEGLCSDSGGDDSTIYEDVAAVDDFTVGVTLMQSFDGDEEGNQQHYPPIPPLEQNLQNLNPMQRKTSNVMTKKTTATKRNATIKKASHKVPNKPVRKKSTTVSEAKGKRKETATPRASRTSNNSDEYVDKLVAFYVNSEFGRKLVQDFGKKWCCDAVTKVLEPKYGHIVGKILRKVSKRSQHRQYEVAWEHTSLGESVVEEKYLLDGCIVAERIRSIRLSSSTTQKKRKRRSRRLDDAERVEHLRQVLQAISDDECCHPALSSDDESLDGDEDDVKSNASSLADDEWDFLLFGNDPQVTTTEQSAEHQVLPANISGLTWETTREVTDYPANLKPFQMSQLKTEYADLFKQPIDALFALIPYVTWEVIVVEINRYATSYLAKTKKRTVAGYKWQAVTVSEMLIFFGIMIYFMLYPQTGRRTIAAWTQLGTFLRTLLPKKPCLIFVYAVYAKNRSSLLVISISSLCK